MVNNGFPSAIAIDAVQAYKNRFRRELAARWPEECVSKEEAGPDVSDDACIRVGGALRTIPVWKCVITGDAKHVVFNVEDEIPKTAADAKALAADVNDAVMWWTRPCVEPRYDAESAAQEKLSAHGHRLLAAVVRNQKDQFAAGNRDLAEVRRFLASPDCHKHAEWGEAFLGRGRPPRQTVTRAAARAVASLHATSEGHGWSNPSQYIEEARSSLLSARIHFCNMFDT
jgi:hypothetical protein